MEFGTFVAGYRNVSHCYQRPDLPRLAVQRLLDDPRATRGRVSRTWRARSRGETGVDDHRVLYSSTEYKKIRLPYFVPEYDRWEELCEPQRARAERRSDAPSGSRDALVAALRADVRRTSRVDAEGAGARRAGSSS